MSSIALSSKIFSIYKLQQDQFTETHIGREKEYLFGKHVRELVLGPLECKERANDKGTTKGEADGKFLGHQNHDRKEHGESNEDEEDPCRKQQPKVHQRLPRGHMTCGRLKASR